MGGNLGNCLANSRWSNLLLSNFILGHEVQLKGTLILLLLVLNTSDKNTVS